VGSNGHVQIKSECDQANEKHFSLTVQDDYSGYESTKIGMAQIIFQTNIALSGRKHPK